MSGDIDQNTIYFGDNIEVMDELYEAGGGQYRFNLHRSSF